MASRIKTPHAFSTVNIDHGDQGTPRLWRTAETEGRWGIVSGLGLILAFVFFLVGITGTLLPALPGVPLVFVGMVVYGLVTGFATLDVRFYVIQGAATVLALVIDYAATAYGTRRYGGSTAAILGGTVGILVGPFVLGPLGIVLGPFLGALVGEMLKGKRPEEAFRAAVGTLVGLVGSTLVKLIIEAGMIAWFLIEVL